MLELYFIGIILTLAIGLVAVDYLESLNKSEDEDKSM